MRIPFSLCIAILTLGISLAAQPKYGVSVKALNKDALASARTYVWKVTQPSFDKTVDTFIVAAVDRELAARGLTKVTTGRGDATVTYASIRRTDVDTERPQKDGSYREYPVGTLAVELTDASGRQKLFTVRVDTPFDVDRSSMEREINAVVAAMFDKYPVAAKR